MGFDFGKAALSIPSVGGAAALITGKVPDSYARDGAENLLGDGVIAKAGEDTDVFSKLNPFD